MCHLFNSLFTTITLMLQSILNLIITYFNDLGKTYLEEDTEEEEIIAILLGSSLDGHKVDYNLTYAINTSTENPTSDDISEEVNSISTPDIEDDFDQFMENLPEVLPSKTYTPLIIQPIPSVRFCRKQPNLYRDALLNKGIAWINDQRKMGKDVSYWDMIL